MQIKHYENGDSEFTFEVTMHVGADDGDGSSVTMGGMGGMHFLIYKENNKFRIAEAPYDRIIYGCPYFDGKVDAIAWLIEYITENK